MIIVQKVDNGGATVIMVKSMYIGEAMNQLVD